MADKQISSLPQAQTVDDSSLFVLEQQGTAMKATGAQWKGFAVQAVSQYVEPAQQAAKQAQQAAQQATQAVSQIGTAVEDTQSAQAAAEAARDEAVAAGAGIDEKVTRAETAAQTATEKAGQAATSESNAALSAGSAESAKQAAETAKQAAESAQGAAEAASGTATSSATQAAQSAQNAQQSEQAAQTAKDGAEVAQAAIENLGVDATTLESGSPATVQKTVENGVVKLTFGLPSGNQGPKGDTGASMERIEKVEGTGAPGTSDTYNVVMDDGQVVGQFQVYNGADGMGAGDMLKAVYDPTGKNTDVFAYVDQAVQDIPVPDVSAQIAEHNADVSAHPDIRAELAKKETAGASAAVQSNLDTHVANKQNPHATTAEQVGARPNTWTPTAQEVGADPEGSAAQALTDAKAYADEKLGNIQAEDEIFVIPVVTPETFGVSTTTLSKEEIISALDAGKKIIFEVSVENIKGYKYPCYPFVTINYTELGLGDGYVVSASSTDFSTLLNLVATSAGIEVSVSRQSPYKADFINYDNETSGLTAENVQDAIDELAGEEITAKNVSYDNSTSGMTATDVQAAIEELAGGSGGGAKVESGSYVGTGTYGADNPTRITFSGKPLIVFLMDNTAPETSPFTAILYGCIEFSLNTRSNVEVPCSWGANYLEWYATGSPAYQLNASGRSYIWSAILE